MAAGRILAHPPGIKAIPLEVKVWSLNHWTTREFWRKCNLKNIPVIILKVLQGA